MSRAAAHRILFLRFAPWMEFPRHHPHDLIWPLGLLQAEALARRLGWWTRILDGHVVDLSLPSLLREVEAAAPELVLLDTMTPTLGVAREVAARLARRWPRLRIWAVGQHASTVPEDFLYPDSPFTGCLLGELAATLPELLAGGLPTVGVALRDPVTGAVRVDPPQQVEDLDALPPVDPAGLPLGRYRMHSVHVPRFGRPRWGYLLTSRGCPHRCIFCSPTLRQSYGHRFRAHSAERVVDDIRRLRRDHGIDACYLADDLFSFDRERVLRLCELLARTGAPVQWAVQTRADCLDREVVRAMRRAGCCAIKLGVESGVDRVLALLRKDLTRERIRAAAREIRAAGISLTACYMLGNPTETEAEMETTFRFARELRADLIQVSFHTPYPGSESHRRHGHRVTDPGLLNHYDLHAVTLGPVTRRRLERLQRRFYRRYYRSPEVLFNYLRRRAVYRLLDPDEWRLVLRTLRYLWLPQAPPTTHEPAPTAARSAAEPADRPAQVVPLRRRR